MEKKFIELGVDEIQAVVGGVKVAATMYQPATVAHVSRPLDAHAEMAAPSRPIRVPSLPKR
jgi:hypothetical protein